MRRYAPALLLAASLLGACSVLEAPPQVRGNKVDADQLKELIPGTATRADVTSLLGSPTAKATFDDNTWIYISEVTQPRVGRVQGINSQDVVTAVFDDRGVLQSLTHKTKDDAKSVSVVARATPSPGSDSTFMQQLLGNVGKFTAGPTAGGNSSGGDSGATFGAK
ncbi:outer membrane protein assembly factor BamE [Acidisphaera sp. L21]|uniref:outer membrane protein assembly factor BamE n=1 Tax=Acidisphaera sp. L21 TaxID=1641851 RepID=UPI00131CE000|nr:outer membrane protein assembly factor BamE [Acidisphaera sp. L21]